MRVPGSSPMVVLAFALCASCTTQLQGNHAAFDAGTSTSNDSSAHPAMLVRDATPAPTSPIHLYAGPSPRRTGEIDGADPDYEFVRAMYASQLKSLSECPDSVPLSQDAVRAARLYVPEVAPGYVGSFTAPGRSEKIFGVTLAECGGGHANNWGSSHLVVVSDRKLVARTKFGPGGSYIGGVLDANNDGRHEVFVLAGAFAQGTVGEGAQLINIEPNGSERKVLDFGNVFQDNCGAPWADGKRQEYSVISTNAGSDGMIHFSVEKRLVACKSPGSH